MIKNTTTYNTTNKFSKFVRLNDYCMAEYIFNDETVHSETEEYRMHYLENKLRGVHQIYNDIDDRVLTNNTKKYLAVPYTQNSYYAYDINNDIMLDPTDVEYFTEYYAGGSPDASISVKTDTIRFHFVSGYLISAHDAIVVGLKNKENSGIYNLFVSQYINGENYNDMITFNPHPIYISDDKYDRYIDFVIPSIKYINDEYYGGGDAIPGSSLSDGGFIKGSPIIISLDECNDTSVRNTDDHKYTFFNISYHWEASISQFNEFDTISAEIHESSEGNYFEYGLTTTSGSVSNWFSRLNTGGDKWAFIHQINVYEHLKNGETFTCDTVTTYQSSNFDTLSKYRPVLLYAHSDVMFSIDYMVRIINESTGEQLIRTSACSSRNINAYGKNTLGISDLYKVSSYKIYNKIFKTNISNTEMFDEPNLSETSELYNEDGTFHTQRVEYPIYVDRNKVCVSNDILTSESISDNRIIYNQFDLWLIVDSIDNIFSFTIYKIENGKMVPYDLSINNSGIYYKLIFNIDNAINLTIDPLDDDNISLKNGEIMFAVSEEESRQILESSSNDFYISAYNYSTMKNSPIYKGFWVPNTKYDEYQLHVEKVRSDYAVKSENARKLDELTDQITNPLETIPQSVYIPGYTDTASNSDVSVARSTNLSENSK